jgi:hypothetical protein
MAQPAALHRRADARGHGSLAGHQVVHVVGKAGHHLVGEPLESLPLLVRPTLHSRSASSGMRVRRLADRGEEGAPRRAAVVRRAEEGGVHPARDHVHPARVQPPGQALAPRGPADGEHHVQRAEDARHEPLVWRRGERHVAPDGDGGGDGAGAADGPLQRHRKRRRHHGREEHHVHTIAPHDARDAGEEPRQVSRHAVRRRLPRGLQQQRRELHAGVARQGIVQPGGHPLHPADVGDGVARERKRVGDVEYAQSSCGSADVQVVGRAESTRLPPTLSRAAPPPRGPSARRCGGLQLGVHAAAHAGTPGNAAVGWRVARRFPRGHGTCLRAEAPGRCASDRDPKGGDPQAVSRGSVRAGTVVSCLRE